MCVKFGCIVVLNLGLEYLYRGCSLVIFYCDVKSNNILLGYKMVVKVVDFGFFKLMNLNEVVFYVFIMVKGIMGYLDFE